MKTCDCRFTFEFPSRLFIAKISEKRKTTIIFIIFKGDTRKILQRNVNSENSYLNQPVESRETK